MGFVSPFVGEILSEEGKHSFFEKKEQKTFPTLVPWILAILGR